MNKLNYRISGVSALVGQVISISEWAEMARIPDKYTGEAMKGEKIKRILGIESKSWDPKLFQRKETIVSVAQSALDSAGLQNEDIDAALIVTCSPYEIMLDQDAFQLFRKLGLKDSVIPIQLSAGCGGLARALAVAAKLDAEKILIVTYSLASCVTGDNNFGVNETYQENDTHPVGHKLWASPGLFSDAAAAVVITKNEKSGGFVFYSRDSQSFGDEPGFEDPLIHYLGGGALHPPGTRMAAKLSTYGMNSKEVKRYYSKGMMLNHQSLLEYRPAYVSEVKRIYTHQASPALIEDYAKTAQLPKEKVPTNAQQFGNLVSPCTLKMLHDDLLQGKIKHGDEVCFSVVGAGPERGAFIMPVNVKNILKVVPPHSATGWN
jgi:3-oxoacyl-[acyl-carrier-protein] synthase-3